MIEKNKVLVFDIDGTICPIKTKNQSYGSMEPFIDMKYKMQNLHKSGWHIILFTSRGMYSNNGNVGKINIKVLPDLIEWLNNHSIPFDELHIGKPWPGYNGFYIDDRCVRPREFLDKTIDELEVICNDDRLNK